MKIELNQADLRRQLANSKLASAIYGKDDLDRARALEAVAATLRDQGAFELSHELLEQAFAIDPESCELRRSLGLSRCRMGDLAGGMTLYDSGRWHLDSFNSVLRPFSEPEWKGQPLKGKSILLWAEQGVGDQLMQARCLKWILKQRPSRVAVEADPRLSRLIEDSFPGVECFSQTVEPDPSLFDRHFDYQSSLFSAWRWTYAKDQFARRPYPAYLKYNSDLSETYRHVWKRNGWNFNVGISWRSRAKATGDRKSIEPRALAPLMQNHAVQFHNLQYGCPSSELDELAPEFGRRLLEDKGGDPMKKLYRLGAQIAALDLVISVDNTTVHLAGGVGTPCFVFLPKFNDWRWGYKGENTGLYESLSLFRQNHPDNWEDVILRAGLELRKLVG